MSLRLVVSTAFLAALTLGAAGGEVPSGEFQAEQTAVLQGGKTQVVYRVQAAPDMVRLEHGGKHSELVTIQRRDLGVIWTLVPATRRYTEETLAAADFAEALRITGGVTVEETLGSETIDGMLCEKRRVSVPVIGAGKTGTTEAVVWMSPQLPYPVRLRRPDGSVSELKNIRVGSQPEGAFEVPDDYVKVDGIMAALSAPPAVPAATAPAVQKPKRPDAFNVKSYKLKFGVPL